MKFDPDVIDEVMARAMNGVEFEDAEVIAALEKVVGSMSLYGDGDYGSLVERAAAKELRARNPQPPKQKLTLWQRLAGKAPS